MQEKYDYKNAFIKRYKLPGGEKVVIHISDSGETISIKTKNGNEIGKFDLTCISEIDFNLDENNYFILHHMAIEAKNKSYVRKGIGSASLSFHREVFGAGIYATENYASPVFGEKNLRVDEYNFVTKMIAKKILDGYDF